MHSDLWGPTLGQGLEAGGRLLRGQMLAHNRAHVLVLGSVQTDRRGGSGKPAQAHTSPGDGQVTSRTPVPAAAFLAVDTSGLPQHPRVGGGR